MALVEHAKIIEFLELVGRLKHIKRTGWLLCDINDCETIAGHMYRMGLMTFLLTEENNPTKLDRSRCLEIGCIIYFSSNKAHIRIRKTRQLIIFLTVTDFFLCQKVTRRVKHPPDALVHDLAECIVGDLTPHCGVEPDEKHRREAEAMKQIAELTGIAGDRMYNLYMEYETQSSPEAMFAKDLDRYDMVLQAFEYEKRENSPKKLEEFFTATYGKFNHPFIQDLAKELYKQRDEFAMKTLVNGNT